MKAPLVALRGPLRLRFAATVSDLALPCAGAQLMGEPAGGLESRAPCRVCRAFSVRPESRLEQGCGYSHRPL